MIYNCIKNKYLENLIINSLINYWFKLKFIIYKFIIKNIRLNK